jgi:hypothetical protein
MAPVPTFALLLGLYFALLLLVARWRSSPVPSRAVQLLRAFFPSWRFFEDVGDVGTLYVRTGSTGAGDDALGSWQPLLPQPRRHLGMLVVASEVNLLLACRSLVQQLQADLEDADEAHPERLTASVSYRLVHDLVRFRLAERAAARGTRFQWKLRAGAPGGDGTDVLVSPVGELA